MHFCLQKSQHYNISSGNISSGNISSGTVESADGQYNIAKAPLYFVRSGRIGIDNGRLRYSGVNGYEWSSNIDSSDLRYAYYLYFDASVVNPSSNNNRWGGFPLRCLARQ